MMMLLSSNSLKISARLPDGARPGTIGEKKGAFIVIAGQEVLLLVTIYNQSYGAAGLCSVLL